ncbi:sugar phosphate isomerase/epimerase family protein [Bacteroidota bacterium]
MKNDSRRNFIRKAGLLSAAIPFAGSAMMGWTPSHRRESLDVHIFSKHLQFLDYKETGEIAAKLGFAGVDLTVRPDGHVLPENVKNDLPRAVKTIQDAGSRCELITTNVESIHVSVDVNVIRTAAMLGIKYYRSNWFSFPEDQSMPEALENYSQQIKELSELNRECGIIGCYQNIKGIKVGSSFWEVKKILERADPAFFGSEFDIRHATLEGANSWENAVRLLHPHIKTIVIKDFKWGMIDGKWEAINTPVGEGMVNFTRYFSLLKQYGIAPPVTLHIEYPIGGAEHGDRELSIDKEKVYAAMKNDLDAIQKMWKDA